MGKIIATWYDKERNNKDFFYCFNYRKYNGNCINSNHWALNDKKVNYFRNASINNHNNTSDSKQSLE